MNLKESIGRRITQSRKALGMTIKELAARTERLSAQRIANYERYARSPGPEEAMLLAKQLNISASYLLCLTDNPQGEFLDSYESPMRKIPVLSMRDALHAKEILEGGAYLAVERLIVIDEFNPSKNNNELFAVVVEDNSMQADFSEGNVVVIDPKRLPNPGDFVLAYLTEKKQVALRKYREAENCLFQLLASNELWATFNAKQPNEVVIMGVVVEHRRFF